MPFQIFGELEAKNKMEFKTPDVKIEIPPSINELMMRKQPESLYLGDRYNMLIELVNKKETEVINLKKELVSFEDKAASLIIKICLAFCGFLLITAIWAFLLGR